MTSGEVLLLLLRAAIHGEIQASLPVAVDWKEVSELATRQGVGAIAADGLQRILDAHPAWGRELDEPENEEIKYDWFGQTFYAEESYAKYTRAIASLAQFYNEHGFQMMILKGYACSLNYPVPSHRPCGDIDIWQFGRQKEADAALASTPRSSTQMALKQRKMPVMPNRSTVSCSQVQSIWEPQALTYSAQSSRCRNRISAAAKCPAAWRARKRA